MENRYKILIVDDNNENIRVLLEVLKRDYQLNATTDGRKAIELAKTWDPDVILLDVVMPDISGYDVCIQLKSLEETKYIPVVFVTAVSDKEEEIACINVGAIDYLTKPLRPDLLKAKIKNYVEIKDDRKLLTKIIDLKKESIDSLDDPLKFLSLSSSEFRSREIGLWHTKRCEEMAKVMVKHLLRDVNFAELSATTLAEAIVGAVPYHDIGKSVLPDSIILKPDKLSNEEFELMKKHVLIGSDLVETIKSKFEDRVYLQTVLDTIKYHHERWDGTGYPEGLSKKNIPLCARVMAIIDQYDTLISERIYKQPSFHFEATRIIVSESGKGFDPELVEAFLEVQELFLDVQRKFTDSEKELDYLKTILEEVETSV